MHNTYILILLRVRVFMKCRLHHVPGYHNTRTPDGQELGSVEGFRYPDPTIKEEVYVGK